MVILQGIIHQVYFVMTGIFALLLMRGFVRRTTRLGLLYDIVYAYTVIPFLLRALHVK